jgi:hypothetical protein
MAQQLGEDGLLLYSNAHRFWNDPGVMQGIWDVRDPFMTGVYQFQENPPAPRRRVMRDLDGPLTVMPPSKSEA